MRRHRWPRWLAGQRPLDVALIGAVGAGRGGGDRARRRQGAGRHAPDTAQPDPGREFGRPALPPALSARGAGGRARVYAVLALPPAIVLPVLVAAVVVGRPSVQGGPLDFAGQQLPLLLAIGLAV